MSFGGWVLNPWTRVPTKQRPFGLMEIAIRAVLAEIVGFVLGAVLRWAGLRVTPEQVATIFVFPTILSLWLRPAASVLLNSVRSKRLDLGMLPYVTVAMLGSYVWLAIFPLTPKLAHGVPSLGHWMNLHGLWNHGNPTGTGIVLEAALSLLLAAILRKSLQDFAEHEPGRAAGSLEAENSVLRQLLGQYERAIERMFRGRREPVMASVAGSETLTASADVDSITPEDERAGFLDFERAPSYLELHPEEPAASGPLPEIDFSKADFRPPKK